MSPEFSSETDPGLNFIVNQKCVKFISKIAQSLMKLFPKMIVSAFPLYGFEQNTCNVVFIGFKILASLRKSHFLFPNYLFGMCTVKRECNRRIMNAGPVKFREVFYFFWICIGKRKCITTTPVESLVEVKYLMAFFSAGSFSEILLHLPIESNFQGILNRECATRYKEGVGHSFGNTNS